MIDPVGQSVLVIDDEPNSRDHARAQLEAAGFTVLVAEDGADGLSLAKRHRPGLVLVNLAIPAIDGHATCRVLKSNPSTADTPIILVNETREPDVVARSLQAGADDCVRRPVDWETIGDRVVYVHAKLDERRRQLDGVPHAAAKQSEETDAAHQAQLDQLNEALAKAHATAEAHQADLESSRVASAREMEDLIARHAHEIMSLKQQAEVEKDAAIREVSEHAHRQAERYEQQLDEQRQQIAEELSSALANHEQERQDLAAVLAEMSARLDQAGSYGGNDVDERVAACWSFIGACSTAYTQQVRDFGDSLQSLRRSLASAPVDAEAVQAFQAAEQGLAALMSSFSSMRILAQTMSGSAALHETCFDMRSVVQQAIDRVAPVAAHAKVSIAPQLPDNPLMVCADQSRMLLATLNLLMNAIRFSPHGARVNAAVHVTQEGGIELCVQDQGVGIIPAQLDELNRCLDRVQWTANSGHVGMGVPVTMAIARAHDGAFRLDSTLGGGTLATLTLPAARFAPAQGVQALVS